jgi:adenosylcobinamide-GDP ribazoletransferase
MKKYIAAFQMTQSMFCALPFSCRKWDENCRPYMLLFLPVIGLEIGILWMAMSFLLNYLNVPALIYGLVMCALPYLATGFMHLDGFMDVTDAVKSCRSLERRREILKDSHVGAFAVIGTVLLILAQFVLFASAPADGNYLILIFVPAMSRCCSALAVTVLKPMSTSQYAQQKKPKTHVVALAVMACLLTAAGFILCGKYGFTLIGCMLGYGWALRKGYRSLEGMNGDISGYALTIGELCGAAVYVLI